MAPLNGKMVGHLTDQAWSDACRLAPPLVRQVCMGDILSNAARGGGDGSSDQHSVAALLPLVYAELKALAGSYLQNRPGHTL